MKNILLVCFLLLAVAYAKKYGQGKYMKKQNELIHGTILCSDFVEWCPYGYKCILWENTCKARPCRVFPICRPMKELVPLFDACEKKGCSEQECVLMQSTKCKENGICYMTPNCTSTAELKKCRGYVCPNGYSCEVQWSRCVKRPCLGNVYCFVAYNEELKQKHDDESRRLVYGNK